MSAAGEVSREMQDSQARERPLERPRPHAAPGPQTGVLALHAAAGNRAVHHLLAGPATRGVIQRQPGVPSSGSAGSGPGGAGHGHHPGEAANGQGGLPARVRAALAAGGGQALDPAVRTFMEARFGQSFSQVRVHTGPQARGAADSIDAAAFTVGNRIWFGAGQYQPQSPQGMHLLAHELAHTLQQGSGRMAVQTQTLRISEAHEPAERAARQAAAAALRGQRPPGLSATPLAIHRQERGRPNLSPFTPEAEATLRQSLPTVTPGRNDNEVQVAVGGQRYRVVRRLTGLTPHIEEVPRGRGPRLRPGINRDDIWLEVDWCSARGRNTEGRVRLGANVPGELIGVVRRFGQAIISREDPRSALDDVELNTFLETEIAQSRNFEVFGRAEVGVDPMDPRLTRAGVRARARFRAGGTLIEPSAGVEISSEREVRGTVGVTITPGAAPRAVTCPVETQVTYTPSYSYQCFRHVPASTATHEETVFTYFKFETADLEDRPGEPGTPLNQRQFARLQTLLAQGYRVTAIRGRTSPEGPRQQRRPGGFIGNQALSEARADSARQIVERRCPGGGGGLLSMRGGAGPGCFAPGLTVTGEGERFTATKTVRGVEREVEGTDLAEQASAAFLASPEEARHRTPQLEEQIAQAPPARRGELVYPLLRRAEIDLVKKEEIPATEEAVDPCPPAVASAARGYWHARSSR